MKFNSGFKGLTVYYRAEVPSFHTGVLCWQRWYWFFFCRLLTSGYEYFHFLCLSSRFDRSLPFPNSSWLCCCFLYFFVLLFADTCPCLFCYFALGVCILGVPWVYFSLFAVTLAGSLLLCMYLVVALSELWLCRWLRVVSGRDPSVGVLSH